MEELRRLREENGAEEKKSIEKRKVYGRKLYRKEKCMEKQSIKVCEDLQKGEKYPWISFRYL